MKTILILIATALLSLPAFGQTNAPSAGDWQNIQFGSKLSVEWTNKNAQKKTYLKTSNDGIRKSQTEDWYKFDPVEKFQLKITLNNVTLTNLDYDVDVFFVRRDKIDRRWSSYVGQQRYSFALINGSSETINTASDDNSHKRPKAQTDEFPAQGYGAGKLEGYIVRLSAYGKPIKTVASSSVLEKIAADPIRMEQLATGKIVPAK